jgi:excisionase family DNA binding protein
MTTQTPSAGSPAIEPWITVQETARLLRVSSKTIYRYCAQGRLLHKKVGPKLIRTRLSDVLAFATAQDG